MRILINIFYLFVAIILSFYTISLLEAKKSLESEKEKLQEELFYYQEENIRLERLNQQTMYLLLNGFKED